MAFKDPKSITEAGVETGAKKAKLSWDKALLAGFLAGAYIAFGAMAAEDIAGKVLAIFFPIMAFVAMGFDHVVANMFFIPAAIFADVPGIGWGDALHNSVFAFLGNLVGAAIFVALSYWYLYGRAEEMAAQGAGRAGNGDGAISGDRETARSGA